MSDRVFSPGTPPAEMESHPGVTDFCGGHWTWQGSRGLWVNDDPEFRGPGYTHVSGIIADFGSITVDPPGGTST